MSSGALAQFTQRAEATLTRLPVAFRSAWSTPRTRPEAQALQPVHQQASPLLLQVLDSLGLGVVIASADGRVLHANLAALRRCGHAHSPVVLAEGHIRTSCKAEHDRLLGALAQAGCGRWGLMMVHAAGSGTGGPPDPLPLGLVPLDADACYPEAAALLVFSDGSARQNDLAMLFFCRENGFTSAEAGVLQALYQGASPEQIAADKQVKLTTVRTQIGKLREKARAGNIGHLMRKLRDLPPVMARGAYRSGGTEVVNA